VLPEPIVKLRDAGAVDAHELRAQIRQGREGVAQAGEIARSGTAQRDAREDAFEIRDVAQRLTQRGTGTVEHQRVDGVVARRQLLTIPDRPQQRAAQRARAHRRGAVVEHREQRVFGFAGQRAIDLEVAARRRIQDQRVLRRLHAQSGDVCELRLLRLLHVLQQRARRADGRRESLATEAAQIGRTKLGAEQALRGGRIEVPGRARRA